MSVSSRGYRRFRINGDGCRTLQHKKQYRSQGLRMWFRNVVRNVVSSRGYRRFPINGDGCRTLQHKKQYRFQGWRMWFRSVVFTASERGSGTSFPRLRNVVRNVVSCRGSERRSGTSFPGLRNVVSEHRFQGFGRGSGPTTWLQNVVSRAS